MGLISYTIERDFPVTIARLFHALTACDDLCAWIWGPGVQDVEAETDLRPGGAWEVTARGPSAGDGEQRMGMRGVYVEIVPPRRLVHTVHWDAPVGYNAPGLDPVDEVIVAELEAREDGCRLWYTHHGIPDDGKSAPEHERSVRATLDLLERHMVGKG